jgi:Putative MetA-pathway of phenol degradation
MHSFKRFAAALATVVGLFPSLSAASCGSAFCAVNTDWNVQGMFTEPGGRAELRYEFLHQGQLRAGSQKVSPGEVPQHHDELTTKNQALFGTLDYNFGDWGLSLILPLVDREHEHIHHHHGQALTESWQFHGVGDIRVAGRRQWQLASDDVTTAQSFGLLAGLKLPSGRTTVSNDDGDIAERSLQPGTGTTDAFGGAFYQVGWPQQGLSAFAQGVYGAALNSYHGYRPGGRFALDAGLRYDATPQWALLLQLNALWRGRDSGDQAEPDDSGGRYLFLSPGLSWSIGRDLQVFAIAQLPLYQYVNGVQLTANWGATAGIGWRF